MLCHVHDHHYRLKAALRRLDVRDADDFDQEEYRAASAAVREQAQAIVQVGVVDEGGWVRLVDGSVWGGGVPVRACQESGQGSQRSCVAAGAGHRSGTSVGFAALYRQP